MKASYDHPASDPGALTGNPLGCWYVVAFAGQGNGGNLWQCVCGRHGVRGSFPNGPSATTKSTLSPALPLRRAGRRADPPRLRLVDRAGACPSRGQVQAVQQGPMVGMPVRLRTQAAIREDLASGQALSCGCRPSDEVARDLESGEGGRLIACGRPECKWTAAGFTGGGRPRWAGVPLRTAAITAGLPKT